MELKLQLKQALAEEQQVSGLLRLSPRHPYLLHHRVYVSALFCVSALLISSNSAPPPPPPPLPTIHVTLVSRIAGGGGGRPHQAPAGCGEGGEGAPG